MRRFVFVSVVVVAALVLIIGCGRGSQSRSTGGASTSPGADTVTLTAAPGNSIVQMFGSDASTQEQVIATFPSGTKCEKISGPTAVSISGISMRFYKLNCDGQVGEVNARWVVR